MKLSPLLSFAILLGLAACGQSTQAPTNKAAVADAAAPPAPPAAPTVEPVSAPAAAAASASASAPEQKTSAWDYETKEDAMSGKTTKLARLMSSNAQNFDFPYQGDSYGHLIIRKRPSDGTTVLFTTDNGQIVCSQNCMVRIRFDDKPAMTFNAEQPADYSSKAIFLTPESKLISELKKSKRARVEVTYYAAGSRVSEFPTEGFEWDTGNKTKKKEG